MKIKNVISLILVVLMLFSFVSCGTQTAEKNEKETLPETGIETENVKVTETVLISIKVEDYGEMILELYPDVAPITVANFLKYVDDGFYNGLTFHRIYKDFMIQGGDPAGNGTGNGKFGNIKGEFSSNGVENNLSHKRGVISMARSNNPDSASCQFFICHADSVFLDGQYAAFGKIVEGFDVLDAIADAEVKTNAFGEKSTPVKAPVIESITRVAD